MRILVWVAVFVGATAAAGWADEPSCRAFVLGHGWDCTNGGEVTGEWELTSGDNLYVEIGNQIATVKVVLEEPLDSVTVAVDRRNDPWAIPVPLDFELRSAGAGGDAWYFHWNLQATGPSDYGPALQFPTGCYELAVGHGGSTVEAFTVLVDNSAPWAAISQVNGRSAAVAQALFYPDDPQLYVGERDYDPYTLWVEWADDGWVNDSAQAHVQVQVYVKGHGMPNQPERWVPIGEVPSPCNPHFVLFYNDLGGGKALQAMDWGGIDLVAAVLDRFGNGDLSPMAAVAAYANGRGIMIPTSSR